MRAVVIVLQQIPADVFSGFGHAAILRGPDLLLLQAAMEPFDVTVAFWMMVGGAPVPYAELRERLHESRRGKLRSVVCSQSEIVFSTPCWQALQYRLLHRSDRFLRWTAMRKIPSHDFPRAAVDYAHEIRPAKHPTRPATI